MRAFFLQLPTPARTDPDTAAPPPANLPTPATAALPPPAAVA